MKVSREQMAQNRRRILEAAAGLFRAKGFDAVTVAEVMRAAGLTHGAFYGHFQSKDDLIAQALAHALDASISGVEADLQTYAKGYLSPRHRDDLAGGCPTAGLGGDTIRQAAEARSAMTEGLRRQIELFARTAPGDTPAKRRRAAIGAWSAMVGAMMLSRVSDDPALADEVLASTRDWLAARI